MKRRSSLVRNESVSRYSKLTCNVLPSGCRIDQLEGKDYTVVPMVILTEGVHAGSLGPLYYPKEELSKTPVVWNHKPIVVYHPTMNGEGVSACDPTIINSRKVGLMMNTRFEGGRLKSEAWIDAARADLVDERIMAALNSKEMMELSTGVFVDVEDTAGDWKGENYSGIARNFRPDHLALLPDQIGACSIADGAGLLRNASTGEGQKMLDKAKAMMKKGEDEGDPEMVAAGKKMMRQAKEMMTLQKVVLETMAKFGMVGNELSQSNIASALSAELRKKFNIGDNGPMLWVADVYSDFVVYEKDGKLWRLGYTASDTGVTLSDETPAEVVRVTEYRTVSGAFVGNQTKQELTMNKQKLIAILLANSVTSLNGVALTANMTEDQLKPISEENLEKALTDLVSKAKTTPAANAAPATPPATAPAVVPVANAEPKKVILLDDYIAGAPREIQDVLRNGMSVYNEEKGKLVAAILANKHNVFTQQDLDNKPLGELKAIARLAAVETTPAAPAPNYAGQAPVPVGNTAAEEALEIPTINFAAAK